MLFPCPLFDSDVAVGGFESNDISAAIQNVFSDNSMILFRFFGRLEIGFDVVFPFIAVVNQN